MSSHPAAVIQAQFPGVLAWYGKATGSWWAYVPVPGGDWLIEAANPAQLCEAIARARRPVRARWSAEVRR